MRKAEAVQIARASGWLSRQSAALQDDLLSRCMLRSYAGGETICRHGDPHDGVYALVRGQLRIEVPTSDGDYKIASVKQPVFWFGQGASLERGSFYTTMTASGPANVLFLPHHEFERLIENAAYCRAISILTLEHFSEASQVLGQLLAADAENRVGARLALLAERAGGRLPVVLSISQSELAEMCGFGRHTVQQILSNLEKRGLIRTGYRRVEILNLEALTLGSGLNVVTAARDPEEG